FLSLQRVSRYSKDGCSTASELLLQPGEVHRLPGAAGRIGARIEKDDQLLSGKIRERNAGPPIPGKVKRWSPGALHKTSARRRRGGLGFGSRSLRHPVPRGLGS